MSVKQKKQIKLSTSNEPCSPKKRLSVFIEEQVQGYLKKNMRVTKKSFKDKYYSEMKDVCTFQDAEKQMKSLSIISNESAMRFIQFLRKSCREPINNTKYQAENEIIHTSVEYDEIQDKIAKKYTGITTEDFKKALQNHNLNENDKKPSPKRLKQNYQDYSEEEQMLFQKFGVNLGSQYLLANGEVHRKYHNLSQQYLKQLKNQCFNKFNEIKSLRVKTENSETSNEQVYQRSCYLKYPKVQIQRKTYTQSLINPNEYFQSSKKSNRYLLQQKIIEENQSRQTDYLKAQTSLNDIIQSVREAKQDFEVNLKSDFVKMIEIQQSLRMMKKQCKLNEVFNDHETITNKRLQHKRIIKVLKKL